MFAFLATLILGLLAVFFVLPSWQEQRENQRRLAAGQPDLSDLVPSPAAAIESPSLTPTAISAESTPTPAVDPQPSPTPEILGPRKTVGPTKEEREYVDAMSSALEALERKQWESARVALDRAAALRPDAPEVADGLARVSAGKRLEAITENTQRAAALEDAERWHEAEETYAAVLAVDPEAAAALVGHERSALRAELDERLQYHVDNPKRLSSPSVLEDAANLLEEAEGVDPRGPRLTEQLRHLAELIEIASTPVQVVIESDNLTDVLVYHVGRLGTFSRRELKLRPGAYTAVGSRAGFRDVRVNFEVVPGDTRKPVVIRCTEAL